MALTMELDDAVAGHSPEISTEYNLKRMYENIPSRELPPLPEWREMPITKGLPNSLGVQIRVTHRRRMAFRWRFRELRVKDLEAKRLPPDWHEWMECAGGEYGVYNCTCDAWDTIARRQRPVVELKHDEVTESVEIVVDTPTSHIQSDLNALDIRSHSPQRHRSPARRHVSQPASSNHIEISGFGLVRHDVFVEVRATARSHEFGARRAQRRLCVEVGIGGVRRGVHALW